MVDQVMNLSTLLLSAAVKSAQPEQSNAISCTFLVRHRKPLMQYSDVEKMSGVS